MGVGQAIHGSRGNRSRLLSLRLINTVIELLIYRSVAAQGPTGPGRSNDSVSCGSVTDLCFTFLAGFSIPIPRLRLAGSELFATALRAWHLDGNRC